LKPSEILNDFIYNNNQHPERTGIMSMLPDSIKNAYGCTMKDALKYATTHCNAETFYAVLLADSKIEMTYTKFLAWGLKSGAVNRFGYLDWEKEEILKEITPNTAIITHLVPFTGTNGKVYQMKITNIHGTHFMGAYYTNDTWFLSDPNCRGVGVTWDALLAGDKVEWVKEFV